MRWLGGKFTSPRTERAPSMAREMTSISRSASSSRGPGPVAGEALGGQLDVAPLARHRREGEAQRIRAVLRGDVEGVDDVAARLRHLLALFVPYHRVQQDGAEGHPAHEMQTEHRHPGDP